MRHDESYRKFFSHPELVRDLLRAFIDMGWIRALDGIGLDAFERDNTSFVDDKLRDRLGDVIWRVKLNGQTIYVYLLLEFQSSVDKYMAVRMMSYLGLLYQDLIIRGKLNEDGSLPTVLPIVLYNGMTRWNAKQDIIELFSAVPEGLEPYIPHLRYFLVDIGATDERDAYEANNLVATIMRLEKCTNPIEVCKVSLKLYDFLYDTNQERLWRPFDIWIDTVLVPGRIPGVQMPKIDHLMRNRTMLAENMKAWWQGVREEGRQEGRQEGRHEGHQEGRQEGVLIGEALILQKQLERRCGSLPDWALARLQGASKAELENWCMRVLDHSDLTDILN